MDEDSKVLRIHEKLGAIVRRFHAEHLDNMRKGVTGVDFTRHVTADVDALNELVTEVEQLESEHVAMGVSLLNAEGSANPYADMIMQSGLVRPDEGAVDALERFIRQLRDAVTAKSSEVGLAVSVKPGNNPDVETSAPPTKKGK
jgi:hypothetical protein